jgi:hypothetical protein
VEGSGNGEVKGGGKEKRVVGRNNKFWEEILAYFP